LSLTRASLSSSFALLQTEDLAADLKQYHVGEDILNQDKPEVLPFWFAERT
jgi:hypothetical protein